MVLLVDCLMDAMATLAEDTTLRCIMDQALSAPDQPHPVHVVVHALPQLLNSNNYDSPHVNRASLYFWKLMRSMLFSPAQPQGVQGTERIALRSCLRAASEIPEEDAFLAVTIPDRSELTLALIHELVKTPVLNRVLDIIWFTNTKHSVRFLLTANLHESCIACCPILEVISELICVSSCRIRLTSSGWVLTLPCPEQGQITGRNSSFQCWTT